MTKLYGKCGNGHKCMIDNYPEGIAICHCKAIVKEWTTKDGKAGCKLI